MSDGWLPSGAANEGQPQDAASWMGVGPLHSIDEVAEGNEVMEKRERQEGITTEQAKEPDTALATLAAEPPACE